MRTVFFIAGVCVLAAIWSGPLLDAYSASFTAHMMAHMGVVAVAAPLIAISLSGTRYDPSGRFPRLFSAVLASLFEFAVVWSWHAPALRALAEASMVYRFVEQASFLAVGLLLWLSCLGFSPGDETRRGALGIFGLLFTSMHMTLLGALLALAPKSLYGAGEVTCFGVVLSASLDQQIGGILMLLIGAIVYLVGGLFLTERMLRARQPLNKQAISRSGVLG